MKVVVLICFSCGQSISRSLGSWGQSYKCVKTFDLGLNYIYFGKTSSKGNLSVKLKVS